MTKAEREVIRAAGFFARDMCDPKASDGDRNLRAWFLVLACGRLDQSQKRHRKSVQRTDASGSKTPVTDAYFRSLVIGGARKQ